MPTYFCRCDRSKRPVGVINSSDSNLENTCFSGWCERTNCGRGGCCSVVHLVLAVAAAICDTALRQITTTKLFCGQAFSLESAATAINKIHPTKGDAKGGAPFLESTNDESEVSK